MTKFEYLINNGKFENETIDTVIIDLEKNETLSANINAKTLQEIDQKLPKGYEMDKITTLQNYFNPAKIQKFEIELNNSQYVYYSNFHNELMYDIYDYIEALENDNMVLVDRLDWLARQKVEQQI